MSEARLRYLDNLVENTSYANKKSSLEKDFSKFLLNYSKTIKKKMQVWTMLGNFSCIKIIWVKHKFMVSIVLIWESLVFMNVTVL